MKKRIIQIVILILFISSGLQAQMITIETLLHEMTDPAALARFPEKEYQSLQSSSYNRESVSPDQPGWFADSDGVAWIRDEMINGRKEYVVMEHNGPGCITRMWTPFFYYNFDNRKGPDIRIYLDGNPKPVIDECFIELLTGKGTIKPPFCSFTARAGVCFLPIPFGKSCKITLSEKAFYNIINYRAYADGIKVKTFSQKQYQKSAATIDQAARELRHPSLPEVHSTVSKKIRLSGSETISLPVGSHAIHQLALRIDPKSGAQALRSTVVEMTFDGERTVWCPIGDFFCSTDRVNPFHTFNRSVSPDGSMVCRYTMPYKENASIRLVNLQDRPVDITFDFVTSEWNWDDQSMHFGAAWKPVGPLPGNVFTDLNFIDIRGKGVLVGDALTVLSPGRGWWGEGDEKIYIDESDVSRKFPSHFGTGTEDYYGWAGGVVPTGRDTFSIPVGANVRNGNPDDPRGYNICTRNRILDAVPFTNRLVFDMEASPGTDIREHWNLLDYSLVTFWYAFPGAVVNAIPQPEKAATPTPSLEEIDRMQEFRKNGIVQLSRNATYLPLELKAQPGQFTVFKITLSPEKVSMSDVTISFIDVIGKHQGAGPDQLILPASRFTCFNAGGIDFMGRPFTKKIDLPSGQSQDLWIGADLSGVAAGTYTGSLAVSSGKFAQTVPLILTVAGDPIADHGYDQGKSLSRLNWLNSTVGMDDSITKGFLPVKRTGNRIDILGRSLEIAENGMPAAITSFFGPSNQEVLDRGEPIINNPFRFVIEKADGGFIRLKPGEMSFGEQTPSGVTWTVTNTSPEFDLVCTGVMEFDGFAGFRLKLIARSAVKVKDIRLEIPVNREKATYMMGLNHEGGTRTPAWKWRWDITKNQDMLWVGAVNGGLRIKWKAENYRRPLVNIYYEFGPLNLPPSWGNEGQGGVTVTDKGADVLVNAYSGARDIKPGEVLYFDFELLITPFRTISNEVKYGDRYYHGGGTNSEVKITNAQAAGANMINIHHAEDLYPFINYPYLDENIPELTQLVANAHKADLRMKFYYTTRELTKNLPEFWAFYSLDGEIVFPGPGDATKTEALHPKGPNEWYIKNLKGKYIPAWYNVIPEGKFKGETDLSVITTPDSRLNNFYIAGLDWMVRNMKIDGVYIDDSALDRYTLKRARKVIDRHRPEGRMDLHSWNHFNSWAGYANCLNLYMDLLPYFDLVWIGEGRDYNRLPDHWLIEVSGIPFGLPGQMLEGGGNPWRGMVYGITNRAGWTKNPPAPTWEFWDRYRIDEKEMIGYWDKNCPIKSSSNLVKATIYKGKDLSIISIGNWSAKDEKTTLTIDWTRIGINPATAELFIPEVKGFQTAEKLVGLSNLTVPGGKGYLIIVKSR